MAGEAVAHAAEAAHGAIDLVPVVALLAAGVIAVPIFRRLGLGSVLGYLAAGLALGPYGLRLIADPLAVLHAAELGVVMFLFIIGLEMEPRKLWSLRRQIFGLGMIQVGACGAVLTFVGIWLGFAPAVAFVFGLGFVLTSTAIVMQMLQERGSLSQPNGQKMVSILLLEDLAIVPLLALVAILAPSAGDVDMSTRMIGIGVALGAVLALVAAGRWILNPVFSLLAASKAREVMTAAALLVVLGAALIMQLGGLSMAMGAFLAGVMLSTSTFKHQLEADVEPFRGILLGLFFLAVGMSLDLAVVGDNRQLVALAVALFMVLKAAVIYAVARLLRSSHGEALERAVLMAQGGEFAFVLYTTAQSAGLIDGETNAIFTATIIISMVLTPLAVAGMRLIMPRSASPSMDGIEVADGLSEAVLIIGFGRFGQIASQPLLRMRHRLSIIDNDTDMIRAASQFGFKVYYGDGTRLDVLRAAGAGHAAVILICVDDKEAALRIAELVRHEFPLAKVMARAYDRGHAIALAKLGVTFQKRELLESALVFGAETIRELGATDDEIADVMEQVRENDMRRFEAQMLGGLQAGKGLLLSNAEDQARESGVTARPSEPVVLDKQAGMAPAK
ncbi:glutathione-regulated potassium-efflux system protein KefB [Devosia enhydra]|uniref:Glutathione-regulated potassium-efflux system protein KefB n=1 Tax=Devosia enhydra TaxID=665118 RepID=A0A1K2HVX0_9HYPH|nr:monovalent cation:proton antiporter-2 (CPA2) family protein [Devosia enhydra]SFZ83001.1 glutathione-regulated potassium-efflux system protein KefB [Devosia enhydra]